MKRFDLKGKIVLITGASVGLGRSAALLFARAGAGVGLVARDAEALKAVEQTILESGGRAAAFPFDLSRTAEIPSLVEAVRRDLGEPDVLVNNAGYAVAGLVEDCPIGEYKKNFDVNFYAPLALIQAVVPAMQKKRSGQIINVTSGVGRRALPGFSAYCTTKFALNGLTESLRLELKPSGIDVILFSPGRVSSEFHKRIEFRGRWQIQLPPMEIRTPEAVARHLLKASRHRCREYHVFGAGVVGAHLNYWAPRLVDRLLAKKYPVS